MWLFRNLGTVQGDPIVHGWLTDSPASPASGSLSGLVRSPTPCLNLAALSSDEEVESAGPGDVSAIPMCVSDDCTTPVNTYQVLSDEDLPAATGADDRRQVIRIRDVSPDVQFVDISQFSRDWDTGRKVWDARHPKDIPGGRLQQTAHVGALPLGVGAGNIPPGAGAADLPLGVRLVEAPQVGWMEAVKSSKLLDDMADSSVPLSPNHVQAGRSQDVPEEGSLFHVSPVSPGFLMQPSGAAMQQPGADAPLPQILDGFTDPVLGDPIAFAQCNLIPGSDTPITLPVYTMPSSLAYMPGPSSVQTVMVTAGLLGRRDGAPIHPRL